MKLLEKRGHRVVLAETGTLALAAAERQRFDVILLDIHMPELDGFEVAAAIRHGEHGGERTPIIALTASAMQGDRERCLAAGMDDYLSKPIRASDLYDALERWTAPLTTLTNATSRAVPARARCTV